MTEENILLSRVKRFVGSLAHCRLLGVTVVSAEPNSLCLELPYSEAIVGNPDTGVIHGGAITTLMDTACGSVVICALEDFELCPTLDLRVDYMRPARPGEPVQARAHLFRQTQSILFARCEAVQGDRTVAHCSATFMRIGKDASPKAYRDYITSGKAMENS